MENVAIPSDLAGPRSERSLHNRDGMLLKAFARQPRREAARMSEGVAP